MYITRFVYPSLLVDTRVASCSIFLWTQSLRLPQTPPEKAVSPVSKARRFAQACSWAAPSCCRCAPAALLPLPETALSPGILYRLVFLHTDPNLRPFSTRVAALLSACLHPSCSSGGLRGSHLGAAGLAQPSGARAGAGPRPPQAQAGSHPSIQGRSLAGSVDLDLHLPCIPPPTHGWGPCVCVKWARLGAARLPFQNPLSVCFGRSRTGDGR